FLDLAFVVATDADDCLRKVIRLCTEFIPRHWHWFHPIDDVLILAPMHKGIAGVANLNVQLQAALNAPRTEPSRRPTTAVKTAAGEFRPGDKVIQLRNNYDKNLFNGDIGTVSTVDP